MQEKEWMIAGGSLYYVILDDEIAITGFRGMAGEVQIPDSLEGYPVTVIGKKAFLSRKFLRAVQLPDCIREIEDWAFAYCDGLEQVELPDREIRFGKAVFLECSRLRSLDIRGKSRAAGALLAAAVTRAEAYYLLNIPDVGSKEWLSKWDARMLSVLKMPDQEGFSKQVLCGEEDYGSTDMTAYMSRRREEKVRLLLLRLLYPEGLEDSQREEICRYLKEHTKGCESEETWQVVWKEHGTDRPYYQLFAELGCLHRDNVEEILKDIGEEYPEMKAFFLRYKEERLGYNDFFADLEL
ncbi:MAG: leucine-rich repeat protein [Lachnospiraceae bacterium]|nr:leucine-rich repeat protein [Lachnospiraceae bacterium]